MIREFFGNIIKFLKALFGPKASVEVYTKRLDTCLSCSWNVSKKERNYCRECGCPKTKFWPFSELKMKTKYLNARCPRRKWDNV